MDYRTTCAVQSGSCFVSGTVLFVHPPLLLGLLGAEPTPVLLVVLRFLGGILFALGATLLGARDATERQSVRFVALGNLSCDASMAILFTGAAYAGVLGVFSWVLAGLFVVNAGSWWLVLRKT